MKQITVIGNTYSSIAQAWRALSPETLKLITVRLRLRNGWDAIDAFIMETVPPADRRRNKEFRMQ